MSAGKKGEEEADLTAVKRLYELEEPKYDYTRPEYSEETQAFTSLVWKAVQRFGAGAALGENGNFYVAFFFGPPTNLTGDFAENVLEPRLG